jgi:hypothetical protein
MAQRWPERATDVLVVVALRSLGAALACAVVAALSAALPAAADTPPANVVTPVDYWPACWPDATTTSCYAAVLTDIDYARSLEGVSPLLLPAHFAALDPARQTFVVTNLERSDRGLRPVTGLTADLEAVAAAAVAAQTHPVFASSHVGPMTGTWWTGVWAGAPNALIADLLWMYEDGWSGTDTTNVDCTAPAAAGCWGHRNNILSDFGGSGEIVAGVASGGTPTASVAVVSVGGKGLLPPLRYRWSDALADGAGGPAALAAWGQMRPVMTAGTAHTAVAARPHVVPKAHHKPGRPARVVRVVRPPVVGWEMSLA